jgi:hypothetical protein
MLGAVEFEAVESSRASAKGKIPQTGDEAIEFTVVSCWSEEGAGEGGGALGWQFEYRHIGE